MSLNVPLEGFGGGGGASLNFDVKAYATEAELLAATPKENTIGVVGKTITSWIFSATEPENPVDGMVWFLTGTSSDVEFNALKKNGLQVYPLSAKQMVGGALVDVTAKSYLGGEWVDWIEWLFNYNIQPYEWHTTNRIRLIGADANKPAVTTNPDGSITITLTKVTNKNYEGTYEMVEPFDLTGRTTLTIEYSITNSGNEQERIFSLQLCPNESGNEVIGEKILSKSKTTDQLAFSGVGRCYIAIMCRNNSYDSNRPNTVTMKLNTIRVD